MEPWQEHILIAAIAAFPGFVFGLVGLFKMKSLSVSVDGRLTELLKATKSEATAAGKAEGVEQERERKT